MAPTGSRPSVFEPYWGVLDMLRRCYGGAALALAGAMLFSAAASAGDSSALLPSASAFPAIRAPAVVADASSCVSACQQKHDQCRVATKDAPGCDAERQRCLQRCLSRKQK